MKTPINTHALTLWILIDKKNTGATVLDAMKEYHSKFSNRLGELEREFDLQIRRLPITMKHRFGHKVTFTNYKSLLSKKELIEIYNKVNNKEWKSKLKQ